jgi:hypothetical protein
MKHDHRFEDSMAHLAEPVRDRQWIFDQVVEHYRRQPYRCMAASAGDHFCAYRKGKLRCWAGALTDDAWYDGKMEGRTVREIAKEFPTPDWFKRNILFIGELQDLHDNSSGWIRMPMILRQFAADRRLKISL